MTVYKGKGLEFDNVVVLSAIDGTYPYYTVNRVLNAPNQYSNKQILTAEQERMESARKFYVALSRAKKRICVSYTDFNQNNFRTRLTPFMNNISKYFYTGKYQSK